MPPDGAAVNPLADKRVSVFAIANIPAMYGCAACNRLLSPARNIGAIRTAVAAARRLLCWLALRGSPAGSRCRPDMVSARYGRQIAKDNPHLAVNSAVKKMTALN